MTESQATASLAVLAAGLTLAALPLLLLRPALRLPWGRIETANLLFTRGTPRWIVMAHRDTKSQPVPTLGRTAAFALGLAAWAGLAVMALVGLDGGGAALEPVLAVAGTLGAVGALMVLSPSGDASPGALDNGTGLAAILALAGRVPPEVAFLVTDGEELGLAGARAVVDRLPRVDGIINLDGLDDRGPVRIAEGRGGRSGEATRVADALERDARELGIDVARRPLPPFVLVDHEPLAAAGLPALTLLKGTWRSLLRVHRPADTADRLDGTGTAAVATLVLTTLRRLTAAASDTLRADDRSGHSPPL